MSSTVHVVSKDNTTLSVSVQAVPAVPKSVKISAGFGNMADAMQAFLNAQAYIRTLNCRICGNPAKLLSKHTSAYYCKRCGMIEGVTTNNIGADQ